MTANGGHYHGDGTSSLGPHHGKGNGLAVLVLLALIGWLAVAAAIVVIVLVW